MRNFLFFVFSVLLSVNLFAQEQKNLYGTVTSAEDNQPVPGVNIQIKGTTQGTFTDENGKYSINAPVNAVLIFSSIGFNTQEVAVGEKGVINVFLKSDADFLDETIIVAYGTVKKGSYSGAASVVKQDAIKDAPVVGFEQVLAGKAAGVQVQSISGQPGSDTQIRIRGFGSFNAGNAPLYVIDGVPATSGDWSSGNISTSAMNYLNPDDIESITILKDAAAASLYGSRASNGVVLITTKRGQEGDFISTFKASAGVSYFAYGNRFLPMVSDSQNEALQRESFRNYAYDNPSAWSSYGSVDSYVDAQVAINYPAYDYDTYIYKDWEDVLFRKGITQNYEFSISGGSEKGKVYASVGYNDQQGVLKMDYLRRFSSTINGEAKPKRWLKVGGIFQYSWQYQDGHQDGWASKDNPIFIWKAVLIDRWPYAFKDSGELYLEPFSTRFNTINPVQTYSKQVNDATQNRLMLKGWAEVSFTDFLKLKSTLSSDWLNQQDKFGWLYGHPNFYAYSDTGGYLVDRQRNINRMVSSTTLNFDNTFTDKHHVSAMIGWEAEREKFTYLKAGKMSFSYLGATESVLGTEYDEAYAYRTEDCLLSILGNASYDYNARYYITATYRRDGSSRLAPDTRWGGFYSLSGSWRFSNEKFVQNIGWINDGKIRASYGTSGTLPSDYYGYMSLYDYTLYGDDGASYPSNIANTDLTWEKNKNWNIGLDLTIFDRYTVSAEYYERKTTDLLLDASVPIITGYSSTLMNKGSMLNTGWELSFNVDIIKSKDIDLSFGANWSTVHNEILSLSYDGEEIISGWNIWKVGSSIYQFYTREYLGINKSGESINGVEPGWPMYANGTFYSKGTTLPNDITLKNGKTIVAGTTLDFDTYDYSPTTRGNSKNMVIEGKTAIPKGYGGFNVDFRWKDLSLSMSWTYKYGHYLINTTYDEVANDGYRTFGQPILKSQLNPWNTDNQDTDVPLRYLGNNQGAYYNSSRFFEKGDYLRLKNLTLSYNISTSFVNKLSLRNARVYIAGANLLTFSKCDIDPEIGINGVYDYEMPTLRTISFGIEVSF